jgi:hypothetical protein
MSLVDTFSPSDHFVIGVDPGQQVDPTAIAVVQVGRGQRPLFRCGHLQRLPLGTSYPEMVWRVKELSDRPIFRGRSEIVVDETGVGRAVCDLFEDQGFYPQRVTITAGYGAEVKDSARHYSVPKLQLVSRLQSLLHDRRLRIQKGLPDVPALVSEFSDFQQKVTDSGRWRFGARAGAHDDLVLALALACWAGAKSGLGVWAALGRPAVEGAPEVELAPDEVLVHLRSRVWSPGRAALLEQGWQKLTQSEAAALANYID